MTKRKTLAITLTITAFFVIAVTAIIVKSGLLEKEEITVEFTDLPAPMSEKIARSIAETSECIKDGALKDNALYNESSKTWWIDLNIDKPGCNPACVIYEDETVEINWRCTGLTP